MNNSNTRKCMVVISGCLAFLILSGCRQEAQRDSGQMRIWIGTAYDVSGSMLKQKSTQWVPSYLDSLLAILVNRGGTLAFGLISERSFEPLRRITLQKVEGRLDRRATINRSNRRAIQEFKNLMDGQLAIPRTAQFTDVKGSLDRFRLFFNEPQQRKETLKVLIFVSDGLNTVGKERQFDADLTDDVTTLCVGTHPLVAKKLFADRCIMFESIDAAIQYVKRM